MVGYMRKGWLWRTVVLWLCLVCRFDGAGAETGLSMDGDSWNGAAGDPFADIIISGDEETYTASDHGAGRDVTLTLSHEYGAGVSHTPETIVNRSSLRFQMDRTVLDLFFFRFDGKAILFYPEDHQTQSRKTDRQVRPEIRECYIQKGNDALSFRVGKQLVVWGETDGNVINDVVSPRDQREFIFTDLEDARMGQFMATANFYTERGDVFLFLTPAPGVDEIPDRGTRYDKLPEGMVVRRHRPDGSDMEIGGKWRKNFSRFDVSLMAASLCQNSGVARGDMGGGYRLTYPRYEFYGFGLRGTRGNFLLTMDGSLKDHYTLETADAYGRLGTTDSLLADTGLLVEYDANGSYTLSLEADYRRILELKGNSATIRRDHASLYGQYRKTFWHDTMIFRYVFYRQLQDRHHFHQAEMEYVYSDHIRISFDAAFFHASDRQDPFWPYRNEDRIGVDVSYWF